MFLSYPWNNFLHTQVEQCIRLIFENAKRSASSSKEENETNKEETETTDNTGPNESCLLASSLITEILIVHKLLEAYYNYCDTLPRPAFMGHLVKILDTIHTYASEVEEIQKCLDEMDTDTKELLAKFTTDVLLPTNSRISKPLIPDVNVHDFKDTQQQEAAAMRVRTSGPQTSFRQPLHSVTFLLLLMCAIFLDQRFSLLSPSSSSSYYRLTLSIPRNR